VGALDRRSWLFNFSRWINLFNIIIFIVKKMIWIMKFLAIKLLSLRIVRIILNVQRIQNPKKLQDLKLKLQLAASPYILHLYDFFVNIVLRPILQNVKIGMCFLFWFWSKYFRVFFFVFSTPIFRLCQIYSMKTVTTMMLKTCPSSRSKRYSLKKKINVYSSLIFKFSHV
jgi:hypothetical protein